MRVFYDANAILSILFWPGFTLTVHERLVEDGAHVITSEHVVSEVLAVVRRKFPEFSDDDLTRLESRVRRWWVVVPSTDAAPSIPLRDPNDAPVLADAEQAQANVLMTGDRDFLDVADQIKTLRALTPRQVSDEYLSI